MINCFVQEVINRLGLKSKLLQAANPLEAESLALLYAVWNRGFKNVVMEGDCKLLCI